jgi:hypothetical protein
MKVQPAILENNVTDTVPVPLHATILPLKSKSLQVVTDPGPFLIFYIFIITGRVETLKGIRLMMIY